MVKVLVIGDSHTSSIKSALKNKLYVYSEEQDLIVKKFKSFKNNVQGGEVSDEDIPLLIKGFNSDDIIISMIGGNQHHILSLVQHSKSFDIIDLSESLNYFVNYLIPRSQLVDLFLQYLARDIAKLKYISGLTDCRIFHCHAPPPKQSSEFIMKWAGATFLRAGLVDKGVSSSNLRLKFYKLQCKVLEKATKDLKITYLSPPMQSSDENGYLLPDYCANDATHANANYDALLLSQIESLIVSCEINDAVQTY